jgi:hypothetical protein
VIAETDLAVMVMAETDMALMAVLDTDGDCGNGSGGDNIMLMQATSP